MIEIIPLITVHNPRKSKTEVRHTNRGSKILDDDSTDCGCSVFFGIDKRRIVKIITAVTTNGPRLYFVRNEIKQQNRANIQATVKIMDPIPAPKNITFMVSSKEG